MCLSGNKKIAHRGYFKRGFYAQQLKHVLKYFDRSQLLVLLFDDLISAPELFYQCILSFLNVEISLAGSNYYLKSNALTAYKNPLYKFFLYSPNFNRYLNRITRRLVRFGKLVHIDKPEMSEWARRQLRELYFEPNQELAELFGLDLSKWN